MLSVLFLQMILTPLHIILNNNLYTFFSFQAVNYSAAMNLSDVQFFNTINFSLEQYLQVTADLQSESWFEDTTQGIFIMIFSLLVVVGFTGNLLMCCVIIRKHVKSRQNLFILNLAVSDIFTCVFSIPFTAVRLLTKNWPLGDIMCKLVPTLQAVYVFVSTFTVLGIAIDRYYAIVQCTSRSSKKSNLIYAFPTLWMISFALALPMFISHGVETVEVIPDHQIHLHFCMENWRSQSFRQFYAVLILIIQFGLPLIVVGGLHILICKFMCLRLRLQPACFSNSQRKQPRSVMRHRKNVILLTAASLSFVVTWLPWAIINLLADVNYKIFEGVDFLLLHTITHAFAMLSVCINPLVYGWFNTAIRRGIEIMIFQKNYGLEQSTRFTTVGTDRKSSKV